MFITVESGATKTAWRAVYEDGTVRSAQTAGLSPTCLNIEHTQEIVRQAIPELNPQGRLVKEIFFYGAGLVSPESWGPLEEALQMYAPFALVKGAVIKKLPSPRRAKGAREVRRGLLLRGLPQRVRIYAFRHIYRPKARADHKSFRLL